MVKKRKNKKGFTFEQAISLVDWDFNRIEDYETEAFWAFENAIESSIEKHAEKLKKALRSADERIRMIASEAVEIAFEHQLTAYFCDISENPWSMSIYMEDFAEDGYSIELDIREPIRQMLLERCDKKDGFVVKDQEKNILKFAEMLDSLSTELKTAIRPENTNA